MKEQKVRLLQGSIELENKINSVIHEENEKGFELKSITALFTNKSNWVLLFEKEVKEHADER